MDAGCIWDVRRVVLLWIERFTVDVDICEEWGITKQRDSVGIRLLLYHQVSLPTCESRLMRDCNSDIHPTLVVGVFVLSIPTRSHGFARDTPGDATLQFLNRKSNSPYSTDNTNEWVPYLPNREIKARNLMGQVTCPHHITNHLSNRTQTSGLWSRKGWLDVSS